MNSEAQQRMTRDVAENPELYQALAGNFPEPDPIYPSEEYPRDEWNPVIRYHRFEAPRSDDTNSVHKRYPVLCPRCSETKQLAPYEHTDDDVIHTAQLITDGHTTVCVNPHCDYETTDSRQIRSTVRQTKIGPFKDRSRPRYEYTGTVILPGGF